MPTLTTSGLCLFKAGVHARTAVSPFRNVSGSAEFIELISGAEGVICNEARYNFISNYSNLNVQTRAVLSDAVSSYVAAQLIANDMSVFTSRVEAEGMINLYMANYEKSRKVLADKKFSDFLRSGSSQ